jgi:hypothetical protein
MRYYKSLRNRTPGGGDPNRWRLADEFRETYGRDTDDPQRRFPVHFLGLWDTVSSVGWLWEPESYPYTYENPSVAVVRHAVALDERRSFFRQNRVRRAVKPGWTQDWKQTWFAGSHCDIVGGYKVEQGALWLVAFQWMLEEAERAGLKTDPDRRLSVLTMPPPPPSPPAPPPRPNVPYVPWLQGVNPSLVGWWKLAEYVPKRRARSKKYLANFGRPRRLDVGECLHRSVLLRLMHASLDYCPENLTPEFVTAVKAADEAKLPECLSYRPDGDLGL